MVTMYLNFITHPHDNYRHICLKIRGLFMLTKIQHKVN